MPKQDITIQRLKLTLEGALLALNAAIEKAKAIGCPQCISIVDDGGNLLCFARMEGSKILSIDTSLRKALTAVSSKSPTGHVGADLEGRLALATAGRFTNLRGGLPILVDGHVIGGIGVGSGTGDQDLDVAKAGIDAIERAVNS